MQPYFAYGSNLNRDDMGRRCPGARPGARARLHGWCLTFRGVANIERDAGGTVEGALWWLTEGDVCSLDSYEGAPSHYVQRLVEVETDAGEKVEAMTYAMTHTSYLGLPSPWYLERIATGFRQWGLPMESLEDALHRAQLELHRLGVADLERDGRKRLRAVAQDRTQAA
jgi:cation transport regulator ChaC